MAALTRCDSVSRAGALAIERLEIERLHHCACRVVGQLNLR